MRHRLAITVAVLGLAACSGGGGSPAAPGLVSSSTAPSTVASAKPLPTPTTAQTASPKPTPAVALAASNQASDPGPNPAYEATQPFYSCLTNYYVSTTGSDSNSGSSPATSWLTISHAAAQTLGAGSCINLSPGTYLQSSMIAIYHGGDAASPAGYAVWRCSTMPFHFSNGALQGEGSGCVIRANALIYALFQISAPYVAFDGIELDGNNWDAERGFAIYTLSAPAPPPHHLVVLNSDVHHFGDGGFALNKSDWMFVLHDVWHDNSVCSPNYTSPCRQSLGDYGSGFSVWEPKELNNYSPTQADQAFCATIPVPACFHIVVAYNVAYNNYNFQSGQNNGDGEGIIFDTWSANSYGGPGLIMSNLVYNNGGAAIKCFNSSANGLVVIANNSTYGDAWDTHDPGMHAEIAAGGCNNAYELNNIAFAVPGTGVLANNAPFFSATGGANVGGNVTYQNNIAYGGDNALGSGYTYPMSGTNANMLGVNPAYATATNGSNANNFALQTGSPAIGFGQAFSLENQTSTADAGACQHELASCP